MSRARWNENPRRLCAPRHKLRSEAGGGSLVSKRVHMNRQNRFALLIALLLALLVLSGCSLFGPAREEPAATDEAPSLVPTWTPTPQGEPPTPTPTISFDLPAAGEPQAAAALPLTQTAPLTGSAPLTGGASLTATGPVTATTPLTAAAPATATAAARARFIVEQDAINVRTGPGTGFGLGGSATKGQEFDIVSKNAAGDWWQVCCVNGEPVWIFGALGRAENAQAVPVGDSLAPAQPAPVAQAPAAPAQPAPAQPDPPAAPAPAEPAPAEPAPPPADDPCAGIGGDGCKFKLTGGPAFTANGGGELKLTLAFIHSGIDGGQPQGSYFVVLLKDGQNANVPDSVRSFDPSVGMQQGPSGRYNYEYKIAPDQLPGGTVAGNYTIWVLDGNGERDSQNFSFSVPDGQGEVWIQFDQA